jgi:glycerol-3-phosphate dehydrogenase
VRYPEYITDDARLTLENAQSAAEHGALVVNHARVQDLRLNDGRVAGCSVVDLMENWTVEVSTKLIVNATGAWSAGLLAEAGLDAEFSQIPSKGIHILLSADRLPITGATFLRARNGKRGLAMRRLNFVYVGTTDDEYDGSLDGPRATRSELDEVLDMVSDCFPEQKLGYEDILATWAGVHPLIREESKSTRDVP